MPGTYADRRRNWTDDERDRLTAMSADPTISINEMARRLCRAKASVVRQRRQLGLDDRQSPIKHGHQGTQHPRPLRRGESTLAPLPSLSMRPD
jgi:transposase-like protein